VKSEILPVKQRDSIGCGPACILMVARALRKHLTHGKIAKVTKYKGRGGLSNSELVVALKDLGFYCREESSVTWKILAKEAVKPDQVVIVSWMLEGVIGHFSVVKKVTFKHILLVDSKKGNILKIDKMRFMRLWLDYDEMWYPKVNTDIQLRWMLVVSLHKK